MSARMRNRRGRRHENYAARYGCSCPSHRQARLESPDFATLARKITSGGRLPPYVNYGGRGA